MGLNRMLLISRYEWDILGTQVWMRYSWHTGMNEIFWIHKTLRDILDTLVWMWHSKYRLEVDWDIVGTSVWYTQVNEILGILQFWTTLLNIQMYRYGWSIVGILIWKYKHWTTGMDKALWVSVGIRLCDYNIWIHMHGS